jgi:phthiocerol/phenolphthiocerol synthesis type-I polyketide synthase C
MEHRVAIVGYAFRMPNTSPKDYWQALEQGRDLITRVHPDRWKTDTYIHPLRQHPGTSHTFSAGSIGDIAGFDTDFFRISPREAALMDPQQRVALEVSWEALEHAAIRSSSLRGSNCGVFLGVSSVDYAYRLSEDLAAIDASTGTGNATSIIANRISYFYDLHGPSIVIDTACSSSLVAFHQACQAIRTGEIKQAIAGGISLHAHPYGFVIFSKASMLSPRGRCHAFDESADGYVRSEGCGLFILKDYEQAIKDGDHIVAVVAQTAVNTDGRKAGLTVPNSSAQAELLSAAYRQAGIDPDTIDYLEAHGTGTAIGDPAEANAIGAALGRARKPRHPLPIGTVKNNLGHLEAASGVAGLVKVLYCLKNRALPPTIGIEKLNPKIDFQNLNIEVVRQLRSLPPQGTLTMGVNSFGFGGVNAHVILQTPPALRVGAARPTTLPPVPLVLTANTPQALKALARQVAMSLTGDTSSQLYDKAYQYAKRREWLPHRAMVHGSAPDEIARSLEAYAQGLPPHLPIHTGLGLEHAQGPVFVYSGNGAQWAGMGKALLGDTIFLRAIRSIDADLATYTNYRVEDELRERHGPARFDQTEYAQPALFAVQVGITAMLQQRGIIPRAVLGHSVGEIAAAWSGGALSMADAVKVIFHRSRLQARTKGAGQMTAVTLNGSDALALICSLGLKRGLHVAGFNSPSGCTIAGSETALAMLEADMDRQRVPYRRLSLDYAFHCPIMDIIRADVLESLHDVSPSASAIPIFSTVTGQQLSGSALDAHYWWRNIRQPVLFDQAIATLIRRERHTIFVEIGSHPVLRSYINASLKFQDMTGQVVATGIRNDDGPARIDAAAAETILSGGSVDWNLIFPRRGNPCDLPSYPWQHEQLWHPVSPQSSRLLERTILHPLLGYRTQGHACTWENRLDTASQRWLADHVVGDSVLFPGAGFAEIALAAAHDWQRGDILELEDLEIRIPLPLGADRSTAMQVTIDQSDGRLSINALGDNEDARWMQHASARLLHGASASGTQELGTPVPNTVPDISSQSHYQAAADAGLIYGPAFRRIRAIWRTGSDEITARYTTSDAEADGLFHLSPALLDSAFQLAVHFLEARARTHQGMVYVPSRIERLRVRTDAGLPAVVRAYRLRASPHSLLMRFVISDEQGRIVAIADGVRFRAMRVKTGHRKDLVLLEQAVVPSLPSGCATVNALDPRVFRNALERGLSGGPARHQLQRSMDELEPLLDSLSGLYAARALNAVPIKTVSADKPDLQGRDSAAPAYRPFIRHIIGQAIADGRFEPGAEQWRNATPQVDEQAPDAVNEPAPEALWLGMLEDYPAAYPAILAIGRTGLSLPGILAGTTTSRDSDLATDLGPAQLRSLIDGSELYAQLDQSIAEILRTATAAESNNGPIHVLDLGSSTRVVGPRCCDVLSLAQGRCTYVAAIGGEDGQLRNICDRYPNANSITLDALAAAPDGYELVVLQMSARTSGEDLARLQLAVRKLAPGGTLLLCDHHASMWIDFVFGNRDDWWRITPDGQLASSQQPVYFWQQQLNDLALEDQQLLEAAPGVAAGPYFLIARKPVAHTPPPTPSATRWLILNTPNDDARSLAAEIMQGLNDAWTSVQSVTCSSMADVEAALSDGGEPQHVIDLFGFHWSAPSADPDAAVARQAGRCAIAAAIARMAADHHHIPALWLLTRNGAHAEQLEPGSELPGIADAALWHFGRTLINESTASHVRMLDLRGNSDATLHTLLDTLRHPGEEREFIVQENGRRLVTRILPKKLDQLDLCRPGTDETCELSFDAPGQLHTLSWQVKLEKNTLAEDEIEVRTAATGLNFRDVMYASGLLSDEAVENGFTGPSMGLEFSGIVVRVGAGVHDLSVGDRVLGFAPCSFRNRIYTKADAVARIPDGVSFEAAATLPSAFFTVYYALHHLAHLAPGEKLLIHGATGGIGLAAIQFARWRGAEIYATAGSPAKRDFLRLLGVENIYDSRSLDFAEAIQRDTQDAGVDVILNSLAGEAINRNLGILRPFGRFVELGKRDFYENTRIGLRPFRNNISYFGVDADQLLRECPQLASRIFKDCMALVEAQDFHALPFQVFPADDVVAAFRQMQHARHIGKIVVHYRDGIDVARIDAATRQAWSVDPNSTYLVTGGTRGFGLHIARWLTEKGAKNIVLASRSGIVGHADDEEIITTLRLNGAKVHTVSCDVGQRHEVEALLATIAANAPPLKGIVHAATIIDDGLAGSLSAERIRQAVTPKMTGAWHLHDLTLTYGLDHFILLSSVTTLLGNPGQSSYVAANGWLEALARYRLAQGHAVTCLLLGPIDDTGFLARHQSLKVAMQARIGGQAITSEQALQMLDRAVSQRISGFGFLDFDWRALLLSLPGARTPRFSPLSDEHDGMENATAADDDFRILADTLSADQLLSRIIAILKREIALILRMPAEKIGPERSVHGLGLDSLMGVELIVALESATGVRLPALTFSESTTVERLAQRVQAALLVKHDGAEAEAPFLEERVNTLTTQHGLAPATAHFGLAYAANGEQDASDDRRPE